MVKHEYIISLRIVFAGGFKSDLLVVPIHQSIKILGLFCHRPFTVKLISPSLSWPGAMIPVYGNHF
jgi:hypothetical protein